MIRFIKKFRSSTRGAAAIEFALAAPVFLLLMFGIMQFGILMYANSGLRQAVEKGARYATIYPRPTDAQIVSKVLASRYGLHRAQIVGPTIVHGVQNGMPYAEITMSYRTEFNLVFLKSRPLELRHTRLAYQVPET